MRSIATDSANPSIARKITQLGLHSDYNTQTFTVFALNTSKTLLSGIYHFLVLQVAQEVVISAIRKLCYRKDDRAMRAI